MTLFARRECSGPNSRNAYGQILNDEHTELAAVLHLLGCSHVWDFSDKKASLTKNRKICSTVRGDTVELEDFQGEETLVLQIGEVARALTSSEIICLNDEANERRAIIGVEVSA